MSIENEVKKWAMNKGYGVTGEAFLDLCPRTRPPIVELIANCIKDLNLVEDVKGEPVAYMYQHEDTGVIGFVDQQQIDWGFEKSNPRLKVICPLYK